VASHRIGIIWFSLQAIFDRKVDLIVKAALKRSDNWLRCKNILESAQIIYAS